MARSLPRRFGKAAILIVVGLLALKLIDLYIIHIPNWGYGLIVIGAVIEAFTDWEAKAKGYDQMEGWQAPASTSPPIFADLAAYRRSTIQISTEAGSIEDGDFGLLRKHRDLLHAIAASQPMQAEQLLTEARQIDQSVEEWRRTAAVVREGKQSTSAEFDPQDYLSRLNAAFN